MYRYKFIVNHYDEFEEKAVIEAGYIIAEDDVEDIRSEFEGIEHIMIGRGYLSHPGFIGNEGLKTDYKTDEKILSSKTVREVFKICLKSI